jgi:hypothetical protein
MVAPKLLLVGPMTMQKTPPRVWMIHLQGHTHPHHTVTQSEHSQLLVWHMRGIRLQLQYTVTTCRGTNMQAATSSSGTCPGCCAVPGADAPGTYDALLAAHTESMHQLHH